MKRIYAKPTGISADEVDRVKDGLDIEQVMLKRIDLFWSPKFFIGNCPFCSDHEKSLVVNKEKDLVYCFSCHFYGDIFQFIMAYDRVNWIKAFRIVQRASLNETNQVTENNP